MTSSRNIRSICQQRCHLESASSFELINMCTPVRIVVPVLNSTSHRHNTSFCSVKVSSKVYRWLFRSTTVAAVWYRKILSVLQNNQILINNMYYYFSLEHKQNVKQKSALFHSMKMHCDFWQLRAFAIYLVRKKECKWVKKKKKNKSK